VGVSHQVVAVASAGRTVGPVALRALIAVLSSALQALGVLPGT